MNFLSLLNSFYILGLIVLAILFVFLWGWRLWRVFGVLGSTHGIWAWQLLLGICVEGAATLIVVYVSDSLLRSEIGDIPRIQVAILLVAAVANLILRTLEYLHQTYYRADETRFLAAGGHHLDIFG